jgi:prepilin-type N-terminal cleavage/methylation domain-containing protein
LVVLSGGDQRGFTLVELVVSMTIMLVVAAALLAALESGMTAERRASSRIDEEQSVTLVLAQFGRDVRGAADLGPGTAPPQDVDMTEVDGTKVRWVYDDATGRLQRFLGDTAGVSVGGLSDATGLALLDAAGDPLVAGSPDTPADVLHCAVVIRATVVSRDGAQQTAAAALGEVPLGVGSSVVTGVTAPTRWPGCR